MEKRSSEKGKKREGSKNAPAKGKKTAPVNGNNLPDEKGKQRTVRKKTAPQTSSSGKSRNSGPDTTSKKTAKTKRKTAKEPVHSPTESTSARLRSKNKRPARKRPMMQQEAYEEQKRFLEGEKDETDYLDARTLEPPKKPLSPYARKLRKVLLAFVTIIILLGICMILAFTVFFKIDAITVEGKTRYKNDEIIKSSQISLGDNLLLYNTSPAADNILNDFPYIETVDIQKRLFNSINIKVTEAKPTSIVESGGKYIVLSKSGKIIEITDKKTYDVPTVLGAKLTDVKLSSKIRYNDKNLKKYLDRVLEAISDNELKDKISTVDINNTSAIVLTKKNGFKIIIGNFENVDYKIKTAAYILTNNVNEDAKGTLDVSLASAESGKSYLHLGEESESSVPQQQSSKEESSSEPQTSSDEEQQVSESGTDEGEEPDGGDETGDGGDEGGDDYIPDDNTGYTPDETQGDDGIYQEDYTEDDNTEETVYE